ncbi:MAG: UPF0280 family protein [Methanospirillaceae archaeon]|nr:UPF0280 family protein [Methanospirillaceae archaeon]
MQPLRSHFEFRDTFATIIGEEQSHITAAKEAMIYARQEIERYIARDPLFCSTLLPIPVQSESPVIAAMSRAAEQAGTGPMAAVAGTIAWWGCRAMISAGAVYGIIDNGGDIALVSDRTVTIGLYTGEQNRDCTIAFLLPKKEQIYGVCTSSATIGHSLSLGIADSVTVFSPDPAVADAYATALCNEIRPGSFGIIAPLPPEIDGVYCVIDDWEHSQGIIPPRVRVTVPTDIITSGLVFHPDAYKKKTISKE